MELEESQGLGQRPTDDRHPLPVTVEVQNGEHIVSPFCAQLADRDSVLRPGEEGKAEVPGGVYQGTFIRRGCLVVELPWGEEEAREKCQKSCGRRSEAMPERCTEKTLHGPAHCIENKSEVLKANTEITIL